MIVLGLFAFGMNPGACLLRDGELVAFGEEERFSRLKGSHGMFPAGAVVYCLKEAGVTLDEVDHIAFAWDAKKYPYRMLAAIARQYLKYRGRSPRTRGGANVQRVLLNLLEHSPKRLLEEVRVALRAAGVRGEMPPVEFVPHHLSHAYTAYYCSPFDDAVVLTIDGSGEETCTQVAVGSGDELRVASSIRIPHSLGWYYAAFTSYFGFAPYRHEGKLMGLASLGYGRAADNPWPERLARVLPIAEGSYEVDPLFTRYGEHSYAERFTDELVGYITGFDPRLGPLSAGNGQADPRCVEPGYVDLAFGVQSRLEAATRELALRAGREHGSRNLCIAGGVGLNCKNNGALLEGTGFERVFVFPACNDAGSSIGAAMHVARQGGDRIKRELRHAHHGPGFAPDEIRAALRFSKVRWSESEDVAADAARALAQGKLVGWFQGRMELGPRALGARSILADPRRPGVRDVLNREVKSREPWRPFCPSILEERADDWFERARDAAFMTLALRVKAERREAMRAAMHVDASARPQLVRRDAPGPFHRLIEHFERESGLPFVVNTSFNVRGEPIVCTPLEAIRSFYSSGLDVLAIGDFVVEKA